MEKMMSSAALLCFSLAVLNIVHSSTKAAAHQADTVKRIRFYVQDTIRGPNSTVYPVAESNLTNILPSNFGLVLVTDTPITAAPERDSQSLGRIQGVIAYSDMNKASITVLVNVIFTDGEFNGSTLSLVGRNPLADEVREVSVAAGTGAFRFARGYVVTRTYAISADSSKFVYQYDAVLLLPRFAEDI